MPILVTMPSLSPTMEKGNLVKWCKNIGDNIEVGDVIAEIDTDKATMEVEALHKGVLIKILVEEGTHNVLVKSPIALLRQKGDTDIDIENFKIPVSVATVPKKENTPQSENLNNEIEKSSQSSSTVQDKIKISPLARQVANEYGIDISSILTGTGPGERIIKDDILQYRSASEKSSINETAGGYIDKKASPMTLAIAKKLTKCKQEVPHFYMTIKADVTDMMTILKKLKESSIAMREEFKITAGVFITKAIALAMKQHPEVNVSWYGDDTLRYHNDIDIAVAVAVEGGIYTPVVRKADTKSLRQIAIETRDLTANSKRGQLKPDEYTGGSITVSNVGMCEIESFYSIINSPQGSIVSISRAMPGPVIRNQQIEIGNTMTLGYAVDHRAIDGITAGKFLTTLKRLLESPIEVMV